MTAAAEMPFASSGGLSVGPDLSLLEQSRQALVRIELRLCQKLKDMTSLSTPGGIDDVQWQSCKVALEAQAKKEAENEKFPYEAVTELSELYQIYENLMFEAKILLATPKDRTPEFEEAEKKIETLLHQAYHENASPKLDLRGLFLHRVPGAIQKLSFTLVTLDLSNNN